MARRSLIALAGLASAAAVALSIALLVSGSNPSSGNSTYYMALNTSRVGQDLITVTPANLNNPNPNDPLSGFLGGIDGLFGGLLSNITGQIDKGIQDIEGEILGNLTKALGVKDTYVLYLTKLCEGTYQNAKDPNSPVTLTYCAAYDDTSHGLRNITESLPSSLVIGTTNISVPLVSALGSTMSSVTNLATQAAKAMFALLIIGTISIGLVFVGSIAAFIVNARRILVYFNTFFGILGGSVLMIFAAVATGVIVAGSSSVGGLGSAFGVQVKQGTNFLAIAWVAAILSSIAAAFWFGVWFVEIRLTSFKRRWRTEEQVGNYKGMPREILADLRLPKEGGFHDSEKGLRKRKHKNKEKAAADEGRVLSDRAPPERALSERATSDTTRSVIAPSK
ncbi:hypothetical protein GQ53DRAFT_878248 [Thozetella sp. PMI_491]|nr:hypothetical protein GQ53DRAFT_878248 [Thozetella sp. PMI_491]